MYHINLQLDCYQNIYSESYLYTGLALLAAAQKIEFTIRPFGCPDPVLLISRLRVEDPDTGQVRDLAIDLFDRPNLFNPRVLDECDIYFKRSHDPIEVARLPRDHQEKIRPFGLVFACHCDDSARKIFRSCTREYFRRLLFSPRNGASRLRHDYNVLREFVAVPALTSFLSPPDVRLEPKILFQTRVWTRDDTTDDFEQVNEGRVALVGALRKAFGERFCGGIVPTPLALERYPDAITQNSTNRSEYIALSKRCLIGIYSRGLHHSNAFKLPEYLAASKCIVAEPLRHTLPTPLEHDVNLVEFRSTDECIQHCAALLDDPDRAAAMRQANWDYFYQHVHPAAGVLRLLQDAFSVARVFNPCLEPQESERTALSEAICTG